MIILHSEKCKEASKKAHPYLNTPGITFDQEVFYWMTVPIEELVETCEGCYITSGMSFE